MKEGVGENICPFSVSKSLDRFVCAKTDLLDFPVCQMKPGTTAPLHFPCLHDHICYSYLSLSICLY